MIYFIVFLMLIWTIWGITVAFKAIYRANLDALQIDKNKQLKKITAPAPQEAAQVKPDIKTMDDFLEKLNLYRENSLKNRDMYFKLNQKRGLSLNENRLRIIWESFYIALTSTNAKTIESRIGVMSSQIITDQFGGVDNNRLKAWNDEIRIAYTQLYVSQIFQITEKMKEYKTQSAQNKAKIKIKALFDKGMEDKRIFTNVLADFESTYQQNIIH